MNFGLGVMRCGFIGLQFMGFEAFWAFDFEQNFNLTSFLNEKSN